MKKLIIALITFIAIAGYAADYTPVTEESDVTIKGTLTLSNATVNLADLGTAGTGTTAIEYGSGAFHQTVLTMDDVVVIVDGSSGNGFGGTKIYDFPAGRILVQGVTVDSFTFTPGTGLDVADGGDFGFGTAVVADSDLGDATDVDLCPSTSIDPIVTATSAALAASAQFDGTTTAKDAFANVIVDDADISAIVTNTVDATVTISWVNLGDY